MPFLLLALVQLVLGTFSPILLDKFSVIAALRRSQSRNLSATTALLVIGCGGNIVIDDKSLHKLALWKYQINSMEAIASQVKHGKKAMPAFIGRVNAIALH